VTADAPGPPDAGPGTDASAQVGTVVWRHAGSTAYVESAERVVVLDLAHLDLPPYVFEGSAAQVWLCVDGDRTETEIVTDLAEAYDVPAAVVTPDVRQFVDRLRDLGLIVTGPDS
jgi:hypothetical protein